jgi:Protein of unknown function (DUF1488)
MALTRLSEQYESGLEGIAFGMLDGDRPVRCLVTYSALTDRTGGDPSQRELVECFKAIRGEIEDVVSAKCAAGKLEKQGYWDIVVTSRDLNSGLFAGVPES